MSAEKSESTATASPAAVGEGGARAVSGDRRGVARRAILRAGPVTVAQVEALVRLERARERVAVVHRAQQRLLPQIGPDALEHRVDRVLDDAGGLVAVLEAAGDHRLAVRRHLRRERPRGGAAGLDVNLEVRRECKSFDGGVETLRQRLDVTPPRRELGLQRSVPAALHELDDGRLRRGRVGASQPETFRDGEVQGRAAVALVHEHRPAAK